MSIAIIVALMDTDSDAVGAVREPPLRVMSIGTRLVIAARWPVGQYDQSHLYSQRDALPAGDGRGNQVADLMVCSSSRIDSDEHASD